MIRISRRPALLAGAVSLLAAAALGFADSKISALPAYTTLHADDLLTAVDVHDTTLAATGTNKKLTPAQLFGATTGDVTFSGLAGTVGRVNGVTYPALPSVNTVPVVGAGNAVSYVQVPIAAGGTGQATAAGAFGALSPLTTKGDVLAYSSANSRQAVGADGQVLTADSTQATGLKWSTITGTGTVTTVSVATANGFGGTVANATTTPAISVTTGVTGLLKGNGTAVSAAAAGTDYVAPTGSITGTAGNVTGTVAILNGGTGQTAAAGAFGALSPLTTKGDLIGFGSANSRLPVGADGQILTADSTQTLGVKWGAAGVTSVGLSAPAWLTVSGSPVTTSGTLALAATTGQTANQFLATPNGSTGTVGLRAVVAADLPTTGLTITQHAGTIAAPADGATVTLDLSTSDWFAPAAMAGNRTLAVSNPTVGQQFTLVLLQDATGSRTVTWFSGILWPGGTIPTLTTTAGKRDVFTFKCISAGVYLGFVAGQNL